MRIKEGFELRKVCNENVIISHGVSNINFTKVISLNSSAAFLWNKFVGKDFSLDDMVAAMLSEYEVDEATARMDCMELVDQWAKGELIEP